MNKNTVILIGLVVIVLASGIYYYAQKRIPPEGEPVSSETEAQIRERVMEFGLKLKNISLLAPAADLKSQMQLQYGEYLTPELLEKWQNDPEKALGRRVSSPWPERIEVMTVVRVDENLYKVEGRIIEVTSADLPLQPTAIYPITLYAKKRSDKWLIDKVE